MLTRLEAHGFKNLLNFSLDFGPLTCIAGPNAVGKSNIIDAIRFLSLLSDHSMLEAALQLRGGEPETSDIEDLFWTDGDRRLDRIELAAEMIVDAEVKDDFGRPAQATSSFLRYEVEIGYRPPSPARGLHGDLVLLDERLEYIAQRDAHKHLKFPHSAQRFRKGVVYNDRYGGPFISSRTNDEGKTEIQVHQDGGSRGPSGETSLAEAAPKTIVATTNTSSTPTVLAAKREMQSWRLLALEPSAMRQPDRFQSEQKITPHGGHLPATLYRLGGGFSEESEEDEGEPQPDGDVVYAEIASRLADLVPVRSVDVDKDDQRRRLTLLVTEESGIQLPARSLSDGTLRFLALSVMAADSQLRGVICMEEPENGIHPARMDAMVELLRSFAVDPEREVSSDNPMRQVIVATHSPPFVQLQDKADVVFAVESKLKAEDGSPKRTVQCLPLDETWRAEDTERSVGLGHIIAYLTEPPGSQLSWPQFQKRSAQIPNS